MTEPTQIKHVHVPRAAKACLACRRQKTRCFPSNDSNSCLRCQSLSRPCSFLKDGGADSYSGGGNASTGSSGNNNRKRSISAIDTSTTIDGVNIIELDKNVKKILTLLQPKTHPITSLNRGEDDSTTTKHKSPFQTSPFTLISNSVSSQSSTIRQLFNPTNIKPTPPISVLTLEIITMKEAITLVDKFKECYGRWISLPNNITTEELINSIQISSPILLTSICVTSLRYQKQTNHDNKLYLDLIKQLKLELFQEISNPINSLEFLKALVILSVYGYSLSVSDFTIDPWFLSGIAVQKFLTLDVDSELLNLDNLHESLDLEQEFEKLSNFRIWNHICLVHLVNCVFSSRMCVLDEIRLDQSRKSLDLSQATNFDGRIVSEISLQLLLYNYLQSGSTTTDLGNHFNTDFESFEQELNLWHEQWNYLFRQPTLQFVEFGYHYVYLVAMYHYQFGGDKKIDELDPEDEIKDKEVLKKFMYHSIRLIDHINGIKDIVYFLCLSDQIHLCTMYTTLLFIKLIKWSYKYAGLGQIDMLDLISKAKLIKEKFIQVSRETNDLAFTFATSIQEAIDLVLAEA